MMVVIPSLELTRVGFLFKNNTSRDTVVTGIWKGLYKATQKFNPEDATSNLKAINLNKGIIDSI